MHRRHPDIVHCRDAKPHCDRSERDSQFGKPRLMRGVDAEPDNDHADEERREGGQHEIVDRAWKARREQAHEMHRPDTGGQRYRRARKDEAAT